MTDDRQLQPFDLIGPLPSGVTVLEASAGTGKTYAIAGLVTRYVAAGWRLPRLLAVTFTRAATAELRARVRGRLAAAADHLERHLAGARPGSDDPVLELLAAADQAQVRAAYDRLVVALAEFDAATVATIHGFCQQVLAGVGLVGDVEHGAELLEDDRALVESVVDDLLVAAAAAGEDPLDRRQLQQIATAVVRAPDARIVPTDDGGPEVAARVRAAHAVRRELEQRKRAAGLVSYDDLLTRLADTLRHPVHGSAALQRLSGRYDVALIDEFQDTDPVQWDIVSTAFDRPDKALVLVGDPKQAIYAFRGADVRSYLHAASRPAATRTGLPTNWRSDAPLLAAYDLLFDGCELGDPRIPYRQVQPAPAYREPRLLDPAAGAPLTVRLVPRQDPSGTDLSVPKTREHVARDVAAEVVALLACGAQIVERAVSGAEREPKAVAPSDIAVLVRTNGEATLTQQILLEAGVPAVINGAGSVFATPAAGEWLRLLHALERPSDRGRAHSTALTAFVGWSAEQVATADDDDWEALHADLHDWAGILRDGTVASLQRAVWATGRMPQRLLARTGGERLLTDLGHVAELLHAAAVAHDLGGTALTGWLQDRIAEAGDEAVAEERARRLESDADAVQVLTIHRSKGLEFPVVFAPFLWAARGIDTPTVPVAHTPAGRVVDVSGGSGPDWEAHTAEVTADEQGERLRLAYVALTRARHRAVVWWAGPRYANVNQAPLTRLLFCRRPGGPVVNAGSCGPPNSDEKVRQRLAWLPEASAGTIALRDSPAHEQLPRWSPPAAGTRQLSAAVFDRDVDGHWRRTSYSAITAAAHDLAVDRHDAEEPVTDDEPAITAAGSFEADDAAEGALRAVDLPLAAMPGGADVGTFVHAVLEQADFAAADLAAELAAQVAAQHRRRAVDVGPAEALVAGLCRALKTPLGPLLGELRLRDLARAGRLDELDFELPLAGGITASGQLDVHAVARLLARHLDGVPALAGYPASLAAPALHRVLRGYLSGSIDLVARLPDGRFAVVDYKTNWLGGSDDAQLSAWHYRPDALAAAMCQAHYPLQALLYAVALHRYLRWRLPGYDPDTHLAGVAYLFLRGMAGEDTPRVAGQPCGVFAWQPPGALVTDLSDLLDAGARRDGR